MDAAAAYCCRYFQNENVEYILLSRSELDFAPYSLKDGFESDAKRDARAEERDARGDRGVGCEVKGEICDAEIAEGEDDAGLAIHARFRRRVTFRRRFRRRGVHSS